MASLAENSGYVDGVAGSDLNYSKSITPELDITYYFTKNIAAELILGTTYANINGAGSLDGFGKIGKVWIPAAHAHAAISLHQFRRFQTLCRCRCELHLLL
ncbi:OmpW family outer membrane protein [Brucella abortus]|nr:OmpW family outer membrane protein [Brucella abortus]